MFQGSLRVNNRHKEEKQQVIQEVVQDLCWHIMSNGQLQLCSGWKNVNNLLYSDSNILKVQWKCKQRARKLNPKPNQWHDFFPHESSSVSKMVCLTKTSICLFLVFFPPAHCISPRWEPLQKGSLCGRRQYIGGEHEHLFSGQLCLCTPMSFFRHQCIERNIKFCTLFSVPRLPFASKHPKRVWKAKRLCLQRVYWIIDNHRM